MKNNKLERLLNKLEATSTSDQTEIVVSINDAMAKNMISYGGDTWNGTCSNNGTCSGNNRCSGNEVCSGNGKCQQK